MNYVRRYNLPDDVVPLVPESGSQVTGQELYEARHGGGGFDYLTKGAQNKWNDAAERLNLRVGGREPWDVLREAADLTYGLPVKTQHTGKSLSEWLRLRADYLEAEAAEKSQRDAKRAAISGVLRKHRPFGLRADAVVADAILAALDAVRGDSGE